MSDDILVAHEVEVARSEDGELILLTFSRDGVESRRVAVPASGAEMLAEQIRSKTGAGLAARMDPASPLHQQVLRAVGLRVTPSAGGLRLLVSVATPSGDRGAHLPIDLSLEDAVALIEMLQAQMPKPGNA